MMLLLALAATSLVPQSPSVRVERRRDTIPTVAAGVSTSLDTNGSGGGQTPIDAERAFAADAQTLGQWTAFAKWSTDDAVIFVPQPVKAHLWLKDRKNPAKAIDWWPTASYISCDGSFAVNTGGWKRPDGSVGYFSTVWRRQTGGGWKWIVDGGDTLKVARPRRAVVASVRASCDGKERLNKIAYPGFDGTRTAADGTMISTFFVKSDGSRTFTVTRWDGRAFRTVIDDKIAAE